MGATLTRQADDVRKSDAYDDTFVAGLAANETNATDLEYDLNALRSVGSRLLDNQAGDWYTDLVTPSALDTGTQRGVNDLNTAVHAVEKKRVLRCLWGLSTIAIAGPGDTFDILGAGELPGNTTAAVGVVTTMGTVVAAHGGTFGTASLAEVTGVTAISPKNLVEIVAAGTRDPVLDAGNKIYGLLQGESGVTDGATITDTTTTRVQISFVRVNGAGNDLIAISSGAMNGVSYDYCYVERVRLEDLNEADFLGGASIDVPAGSTVTRQAGYDNQGTTPVDLTTNATLDLEGAGLAWSVRDDLEAELFAIVEGSAGGTSEVRVAAGVDTLNVDAVDVDFANGATIGSASTGIQVAESAGIIERAADLTLRASGSGELVIDDSYRASSTWSLTGVRLADSAAEWSAFEAAFGEVSLLNAIEQATASGSPTRLYHVQNANETANTDLFGPTAGGGNNLDVDWPDGFVTAGIMDTWVYRNGALMRPGANAAANHDYYPGTSFVTSNVRLAFDRNTKSGDQYASVVYGA